MHRHHFRQPRTIFHRRICNALVAFSTSGKSPAKIMCKLIRRLASPINLRTRHHRVPSTDRTITRRLQSPLAALARDQPWKKSMDRITFAWAAARWRRNFSRWRWCRIRCNSYSRKTLLWSRQRFRRSPTSIWRWTTWHQQMSCLKHNIRRRPISRSTRLPSPSSLWILITYRTHQPPFHQRHRTYQPDLERVIFNCLTGGCVNLLTKIFFSTF